VLRRILGPGGELGELIRKCHVNLLRGMLSYTYVTASCPPLRDGIESTSKSILVMPLRARCS
jgi:hypothetical protein